jgi:activator of HSP90 ATPase
MSQSIHHEVVFKASPKRIYKALTDAKQFSEMTGGAPTEISSDAGGKFSCFGGMIEGRNLELIPDQRLVQAWRVKNWGSGVYSVIKFELQNEGSGTRLVFDHKGFPEDQWEHLDSGWNTNYWEPLRKFLDEVVSA